MPLYNFTLTLTGVSYTTPGLEDALYESGCHDALVCAYGQSVYLEFDRQAASLDAAIDSAVSNIESAGLGAIVQSVDSAYVGLSDVAELTGLTRQGIALLKEGLRGGGDFPCPVHRIRGQSPSWDWSEVANWLEQNGRLNEYPQLANNARILSKWNLVLRNSLSGDASEVAALSAELIRRRQQQKYA